MSAMTVFSGTFCDKDAVVKNIIDKTGYQLLTDESIIAKASDLSGLAEKKIFRVLENKASVFNQFTHEKERAVAYLKLALAQKLSEKNFLIDGFCGLLVPGAIHHVLRICLIADMAHRIRKAGEEKGVDEKEAKARIHLEDQLRSQWVHDLFKIKDPWDPSLYDIVIPTDKMNMDKISDLIDENLKSEVIRPTKSSQKATEDFLMCAHIEVALSKEGHAVDVTARDGLVTLTIRNNVLMLGRLEEELKSIAKKIPGVKTVETRIGKGFYQPDIYRKYDFQVPSKVLLVDDEREFVQTLSERLLMRDVGSAVAYDGESALNLVAEDEPEVMILDLKMPGIDGMEVLKKVKDTRPDIEVIILTGHGSEADKEKCMQLGAFDYLQKPVDIERLSETLKRANEKIQRKKQQ
ncbi:MAG: response regulator [Desulfobacteraceae bacterium]|nr:MAG: response regulator [Desulfobacteraceae bacterium]